MTSATRPVRPFSQTLRYLLPNAVTALSIIFSVLSVQAALRGEIMGACWWMLYSTLTDKLDGIVARLVKGSSPLGVQMDSLADLLNYGFVPSAITYAFFHKNPQLGWDTGAQNIILCLICCFYTLCAAFRLARFNISESNPAFFFGIPSTMAGAMVLAFLLTMCKYGDPAWTPNESFPGIRMFGGFRNDEMIKLFPAVLLFYGWTMVSSLRMPKLGKLKNKFVNWFIIINLIIGYSMGILHLMPEYLVVGGMVYLGIATYAHFFQTPKEYPEPFFPIGPPPDDATSGADPDRLPSP